MTARRAKPPSPARAPAPQPRGGRRRQARPHNPLVQPENRWQRSQRYVWDRRRG